MLLFLVFLASLVAVWFREDASDWPRYEIDTHAYLSDDGSSGGQKPPLYSWLLKITPTPRALALGQFFGFLAGLAAIATLLQVYFTSQLGLAAFLSGLLMISMNTTSRIWHGLLLTESLSGTLILVFVACLIRHITDGSRRTLVASFLLATLAGLTRESAPPMFVLLAFGLAIFLPGNLRRTRRARLVLLILAAQAPCILLRPGPEASRFRLTQVTIARLLPDSEFRDSQEGRDFLDKMSMHSETFAQEWDLLDHQTKCSRLGVISMDSMRSAVLHYWLARPLMAVSRPLKDLPWMLLGRHTFYWPAHFQPHWTSRLAFRLGLERNALLIAAVLAVSWLVMGVLRSRPTPAGIASIILCPCVWGMTMLIWHADSMELGRHSHQCALLLRLAVLLAASAAIDLVFRTNPSEIRTHPRNSDSPCVS